MSLTRDVLIEQVQELERERDDLLAQVALLEEERAAWHYEANRLRAALEKYGQHTERCCIPIVQHGPECTCGLEEALKRAGEARG